MALLASQSCTSEAASRRAAISTPFILAIDPQLIECANWHGLLHKLRGWVSIPRTFYMWMHSSVCCPY
jgi:hypothetical protein